jgi:hypothetical protein
MQKLLSIGALLAASTVCLWQPQPAKADVVVVYHHHHRIYHHRYYRHGRWYYR